MSIAGFVNRFLCGCGSAPMGRRSTNRASTVQHSTQSSQPGVTPRPSASRLGVDNPIPLTRLRSLSDRQSPLSHAPIVQEGVKPNPHNLAADQKLDELRLTQADHGASLACTSGERLGKGPTIVAVPPERLRNIVSRFRSSVNEFMKVGQGEEQAQDLDKWVERHFDVLYMLERFEDIVPDEYNTNPTGNMNLDEENQNRLQVYACFSEAAPVGLISIYNHQEILEIQLLVSHPSVSGAGEILLEKAVNKSEFFGYNGTIYLKALHSAVPFYEAAGFTLTEPGEYSMILDPGRSVLWKQVDGSWRLARRASKPNPIDDDRNSPHQLALQTGIDAALSDSSNLPERETILPTYSTNSVTAQVGDETRGREG
jgi:hypothetical protein